MFCSTALSPLKVSHETFAPNEVLDWHMHRHNELCLILEGAPTVGYATGKLIPDADTLFLFTEGEPHGFWNTANVTARLWSLEFRVSSESKTQFRELFALSPRRRILKLSAEQRQRFCNASQKLAFEKGGLCALHTVAASAWLTVQLVNVTRWLLADSEADFPEGLEEIDPQCFELWQRIHRHVSQPTSPGPMLFGLNPSHDSLRHRFRKLFGASPQAMLIRLRMERAKELLRTSTLSVKEIAYEVGYSRQHDLTRAFRKYSGTSPSEWKVRSNGLEPKGKQSRQPSDPAYSILGSSRDSLKNRQKKLRCN